METVLSHHKGRLAARPLDERLLLRLCEAPPAEPPAHGADYAPEAAYQPGAKLDKLLRDLPTITRDSFAGQRVIDFGSGEGGLVLDLAPHAAEAIGLEIRHEALDSSRRRAEALGLANARFLDPATLDPESLHADTIISMDSMEHFERPGEILDYCARVLKPGGRMLVTFGPPWLHPYGHHMSFMCRVPWFHLFFRERAIMNVRRLYRNDGAARFSEVPGSLNGMTLRRFKRLVGDSPFALEWLGLTPIWGQRPLVRLPLMREFFISIVTCVLRKR